MPAFSRTFLAPGAPPYRVKIDYNEFAENTQTSQVGQDAKRIVNAWKVPWAQREQAKIGLLGWQYKAYASGTPYLARVIPHQHPDDPTLYARTIAETSGIGPLGTTGPNGTAEFQFAKLVTTYESYRCAILEDADVMSQVPARFIVSLTNSPTGGTFTLTVTVLNGASATAVTIPSNKTGAVIELMLTAAGVTCAVSGAAGGPWTFVFPRTSAGVTIVGDGTALTGAGAQPGVTVQIIATGREAVPNESLFQRYTIKKFRAESQVLFSEVGSWKWLDGPSIGQGVSQKIPLRLSRLRCLFQILAIPMNCVNWAALSLAMNKTNLDYWDPFGMNLPPGTVLFGEPQVSEPRPSAAGDLVVDLLINACHNPTGWNSFPDRTTMRFYPIGNGTNRPFPAFDFASILMPPP